MIIACPACATRYAVPDSAIGADGRTVRCAKCRHSWFQDGPSMVQPAAVPAPAAPPPPSSEAPRAAPQPPTPPTEAPLDDIPLPSRSTPQEAPAPRVRIEPDNSFADAPSSFAHEPPFRPRRNPAKMATYAAAAFAVVAVGAVGAVSHFGLPDWVPFSAHAAFADGPPDLTLDFPPGRQDRRSLPDGTQFFGVSGTITNVGKERRAVPKLLILLRNDRARVVYSWQVTPAKPVLAPGEAESVVEAVTDIPRSAKFAEIGWRPG